MESYLVVMFSAFVNAAVIKSESFGAKMSIMVAIMSIVGGIMLPAVILYLTRVETSKHPQMLSSLTEGLDVKSVSGQLFSAIFLTRRLVYVVTIFFL